MVKLQQSTTRNRLLKALSPEDFARLEPHMTLVSLDRRQVLFGPREAIRHLYFIEKGYASLTLDASALQIELGVVGSEGLVGASPILLGLLSSPFQCCIQMSGEGLRISAPDLLSVIGDSPSLRRMLLRYIEVLLVQAAETAFCNAVFKIESRLARLLLIFRDRTESDDLVLTHQLISAMLGVQRPGVTNATQMLEGNKLIKARRNCITILDRGGLEAVAGSSYGLAEAEYVSLIETMPAVR